MILEKNSLKKSYPLLNEKAEIILYGVLGAIVVGSGKRKEIIPINKNATELLINLNGSMTTYEIIRKILQKEIRTQEIENTVIFLNKLKKIKVLKFLKTPRHSRVNIKGDLKNIFPMGISIELTNKCNYRCRYCYQNSDISKGKFLENPIELLKYFKDKNVFTVELTGGEPLLYPKIKEVLRFITKNFAVLGLITNGSLLNDDILGILKDSESCAIAIQINLDGPNKEIVEETTTIKGSFEQELNAIKKVKKYGFMLRVGMVVDDPEKIDMIEETLLIAKKLGADSFLPNPALDFGRGKFLLLDKFTNKDQVRMVDKINELSEKYKGFLSKESDNFDLENFTNCGGGYKNLTISYDGFVKHCPIISANDLSICHWKDISSERAQKIMRSYYGLPSPNKEICSNCKYLPYCFHCTTRAFIAMEKKGKGECLWYQKYKDSIDTILNNSLKFTNKE